MANRKYSDRTPDAASNPLKDDDLIGVSNEDGGGGFDLSKKIKISELVTFILAKLTGAWNFVSGSTEADPIYRNGNVNIGTNTDNDSLLYIEAGSTDEFPLYVFQEYTGGADASASFSSSQGANDGKNTGIRGRAYNSAELNTGGHFFSGSTGISIHPEGEGILNVGSLNQTTASGTEKGAGTYSSIEGSSSVDMVGAVVKSIQSGAGDSIGIDIESESTGGTAYGLKLKDGSEGIGKVLQCITADGVAQWTEPSGGGWLGSETRIKIAPWDIVSYNDKDGVSIQDDGGVVNDAATKITTMVTGVFIPTGYRAVNFKINASANIAVELFESQIWDSTAVSKGSGNANSEINITNVNSTATNYLSIIIVEAGNDIYGGYITIEKI